MSACLPWAVVSQPLNGEDGELPTECNVTDNTDRWRMVRTY